MGSRIEVFIVIRNLEVFGTQDSGFLYQGEGLVTPSCYVAS
jgi:hypothetical protein